MTLSELQIVLNALTDDWVSADTDTAIKIIKREIAKKGRKKGHKPLSAIPPHQSHSDTSIASAIASMSKFGDSRHAVFLALAQNPMTDEECQTKLGMSGNSHRPCRVTLVDAGLVEDSGYRRKTKSKRNAVVWRVTESGVNYLMGRLT
jgi:hypothetical protein